MRRTESRRTVTRCLPRGGTGSTGIGRATVPAARLVLLALLWLATGLGTATAAGADLPLTPGANVAFFGLTFIDTSTEGAYNGVRADETARLAMLQDLVRDRFIAEGFTLLSNDPVAGDLAATTNIADCNGCEIRLAERLGADYVLVGEVQKVSNLILAMNLVLRAVADGRKLRGISVDIRSNTDDSWRRGMTYILKNAIFKP